MPEIKEWNADIDIKIKPNGNVLVSIGGDLIGGFAELTLVVKEGDDFPEITFMQKKEVVLSNPYLKKVIKGQFVNPGIRILQESGE